MTALLFSAVQTFCLTAACVGVCVCVCARICFCVCDSAALPQSDWYLSLYEEAESWIIEGLFFIKLKLKLHTQRVQHTHAHSQTQLHSQSLRQITSAENQPRTQSSKWNSRLLQGARVRVYRTMSHFSLYFIYLHAGLQSSDQQSFAAVCRLLKEVLYMLETHVLSYKKDYMRYEVYVWWDATNH